VSAHTFHIDEAFNSGGAVAAASSYLEINFALAAFAKGAWKRGAPDAAGCFKYTANPGASVTVTFVTGGDVVITYPTGGEIAYSCTGQTLHFDQGYK
jgi:hypothetical protein